MSTTDYTAGVTSALSDAARRNAAAISDAAKLVVKTLQADGLIFTGGAGHSLAAVAETFYRAGGLAPVYPLYHPDLLPLHGAHTSTSTERTPGLGARVLREAGAGPRDLLVVFSNSGVNPYPVELASTANEIGVDVVAINSRRASDSAPRRAESTLAEQATVVLDTAVVPGELSYPTEQPRTGAQSSIMNAFLWNQVLVTVLDEAQGSGTAVPLWRSSNVSGGDEINADLLERLRPRIPALS